jgi:hypothetical protein
MARETEEEAPEQDGSSSEEEEVRRGLTERGLSRHISTTC